MLIGTFIRNYKTYKNLNYINFISSFEKGVCIFIGDNGIGKSSILEGLDTVFNGRQWNLTHGTSEKEALICPVFLIKKTEFTANKKLTDLIEFISKLFWTFGTTAESGNVEAKKFADVVEALKQNHKPTEYYLVCVGEDYFGNTLYSSTLGNKIKYSYRTKGVTHSDLDDLKKIIFDMYRYAYLPVSLSKKEEMSLQAKEIQALIGKSLTTEISRALQEKTKGVSIIDSINKNLNEFMDSINENLSEDGYSYEAPRSGKNITPIGLTDFIISSFFSLRTLNKEGKPFEQLSSGEQRITITEIAKAFLNTTTSRARNLILAIDEPEASLSVGRCFRQFQNIFQISQFEKCQSIVATHWYGLLTISNFADLHHLSRDEDKIKQSTFDLSFLHEQRRQFPADVAMKSFFDLAGALLSILRAEGGAWIVCEGSDDRIYLDKILDCSNVNFLPMGGIGNVIKLYKLITSIIGNDSSDYNTLLGKLLFIIDTDDDIASVSANTKLEDKIKIQRWCFNEITKEASLINPKNVGKYLPACIEDCIPAPAYFEAVKATLPLKERRFFSMNYSINKGTKYAGASSLAFIEPSPSLMAREHDEFKKYLSSFILNPANKHKIALNFVAKYKNEGESLLWVNQIKQYLDLSKSDTLDSLELELQPELVE